MLLACFRTLRMLPAIVLVAGASAFVAPVSSVLAATISGCPSTESQLQADINSAGAGGTVQFACSSPTTINFNGGTGNTGPITIAQAVTLDASSSAAPVAFTGGNAVELFDVGSSGDLTLNTLTLEDASPTCRAASSACAVTGGAILNDAGAVTIIDSTLTGNSPSCANTGSTFCEVVGGAIFTNSGTVTISTSTLSGNAPSCSTSIGAATCSVLGGAIYNGSSTITITNSTVAGNSVTCTSALPDSCGVSGGGIYNYYAGSSANVGGTIFANNTGGNCGNGYEIIDWGYNLEDDAGASCGFSSANHDLVGVNPVLGPLANNGGPTETMSVQSGSPAIDYIPAGVPHALCTASGADQRGFPRPDAGESICDVGAYEYQDTEYPTPNGQNAYDIESSNWSCPGGGSGCIPNGSLATDCGSTAACPTALYGDVEAFGPPNGATYGVPDEVVLGCLQATPTGFLSGYLDVVSAQGDSDYPTGIRAGAGVYGLGDLGTIGGKATLIGGDGSETSPSQTSSVNVSAYDPGRGVRGSAYGTQNTDNGSNALNSGSFRVTITGTLDRITETGNGPSVATYNGTISCTVGGPHANDLRNAGKDNTAVAEGELEPALGDNSYLAATAGGVSPPSG